MNVDLASMRGSRTRGPHRAACYVRIAIALLFVATSRTALSQQSSDSAGVSSASRATATATNRQASPWMMRHLALTLGITAASTAALLALDHPAINELSKTGSLRHDNLHDAANGLAVLGGVAPFAVSSGLVVLASGLPAVQQFAIHDVESIALATAIVGVTKGFVGRALPNVKTRHSLEFGRGFHDANGPFVSFPSGHTAAAFAVASTVAAELEQDYSAHATLFGNLAFGVATSVGVARVVQRVHWPSDLPFGAFIGMWSGYTVQELAHHANTTSSVLNHITVGPDNVGGLRVGWSSQQ